MTAGASAAAAAARFAVRFNRPLVNGAWVQPRAGATPVQLVCPATGEGVAAVHVCSTSDIDDAVAAARAALDAGPWGSSWTGAQRRQALHEIANGMAQNRDELSWLESLAGKPISQAAEDIDASIECVRHFAGFADRIQGKYFAAHPGFESFTVREPVGVCGLITSFNYPLLLTVWKVAPALAAGNASVAANTVVVKPAHQTPLSTLMLAHIVSQTSVPRGVLNVVLGGAEIGQHLAAHPGLDMVSFTGSTKVGRLIAAANAAVGPRRCTLELGGKNPIIVCADADLDKAADSVVNAAFANMGQNCCAGSRLLLHRSIHDAFMDKIKARAARLVLGHPQDPATEMGPVVDQTQFDNIMARINEAKRDPSIRLVTGGERRGTTGYFVQPTIFADVDDAAPLAVHEVFGPVLAVLKPFDSIEEAVRRANSSVYGLAAGLWTNNLRSSQYATKHLRAGMIWINNYNDTPVYMPFGGLKQSGYGKDLGEEALDGFTVLKSVHSARE